MGWEISKCWEILMNDFDISIDSIMEEVEPKIDQYVKKEKKLLQNA